ncbi:hypothetical protein K461DRAFT_272342 [Myriangium duriaei CBS 260.36]|uniref:Rhodopsin domain-containing protein n=1 Tax=Myriangium duriaei CBS 260.36 TaxID=1168546 RepID=A0A9P4IS67_9PEZI|nr:hypothetical protein K461DRAFT_272342 [Myriangium duriaei CBS 260.36]
MEFPNSLARATWTTSWTLFVLSLFFTSLRLFAIWKRENKTMWDFFWIILSISLSLAFQCLLVLSVHYGQGLHITQVQPEYLLDVVDYFWKAICLEVAAACCAKFAIITLLYQIEVPSRAMHRLWRPLLLVTAALVAGSGITLIALTQRSWSIVLKEKADSTYLMDTVTITSNVEYGCTMILGSIPPLRPLVTALWKEWFHSDHKARTSAASTHFVIHDDMLVVSGIVKRENFMLEAGTLDGKYEKT